MLKYGFMWKKILLGSIILFLCLTSLGAWMAWRHLEERLHSPHFKDALEQEISKALGGKMRIPNLDGHLGVHPWVGVENISFETPEGDLRGTARELRVTVELLPLLHRRVVFSQIKFVSPRLRLRRRADGSFPRLPRSRKISNKTEGGMVFRMDRLLVQNAALDVVDESRVDHPSLSFTADVSLERKGDEDVFALKGSGRLGNDQKNGKITFEGQVGESSEFKLNATGLPLGSVAPFLPEMTPWGGSLSFSAGLKTKGGDRRWDIQGSLRDIQHIPTNTIVPLQVKGMFRSEGPSIIDGVWSSTMSDVRAEITLPNLQRRVVDVDLKGSRLDVAEFSTFLSFFPTSSTESSKPSAPWKVKTQIHLENLIWNQWNAQNVVVSAEGTPARGRLTELSGALHQSTITVSGEWGATATRQKTLTLSGSIHSSSGTINGQWQSSLERKAPRDFLFDPTTQWTFDAHVSSAQWRNVPLTDLKGRLSFGSDGVLRATDVGGSIAGGTLTLDAQVSGLPQQDPLTFSFSGKMKEMETRDLMAAISTSTYLRRGRFSGEIHLTGPLRPWDPNGLNGSIVFRGRQGEFLTAPKVLEIFSALKINSLLRRIGGEKETGLPFDVFEASGPIRNGRYVLNQPLVLKNESFQLAYTGWMNVRFESGKGTLLFNFLESTSHVVKSIPLVSSLVLGDNGELLPLVVDVAVDNGEIDVTPRSVKTLTGPLVNVVKNVFRLPFKFFTPNKQNNNE